MTSQSLFASMREFAQATKTVRLAAPEDILSERREWSTDQLALPESQRGEPAKVKLEIRAGAPVMDFAIRSLTMSERQAAEAILDAVVPPEVIMEEPTERPGQPPRRVPAGYIRSTSGKVTRATSMASKVQKARDSSRTVNGTHSNSPCVAPRLNWK